MACSGARVPRGPERLADGMATIRGSFRALQRALIRALKKEAPAPAPRVRAVSAEERARLDLAAALGIDPERLPLNAGYEEDDEVEERWDESEPRSQWPDSETVMAASDVVTRDDVSIDRPESTDASQSADCEEMNSHESLSQLGRIQMPLISPSPLSLGGEGLEETLEVLDDTIDLSPPKGLESGPMQERDARALMLLVQLRFLSMKQLSALAYPKTHPTVARTRMRVLARQGWVKLWTDWTAQGGHPKYAFPTTRALAFAYPHILAATRGTPAETIVRSMIPHTPRKALAVDGRIPPMHFHHQVEVNEIAVALARAYGANLLWVSSWDCPFPDESTQKYPTLPQPDLVAIIERNGVPELLFLENDRGAGSLRRYVDRKCVLYALDEAYATKFFGFPRFTVLVTVSAGKTRDPLRRLRHLMRVTIAAEKDVPMRFTLHAWATSSIDRPLCFTARNLPIATSASLDAHETLEPLFADDSSDHAVLRADAR